MPAFVVLPEAVPQGGVSNWSSGYLPAKYQGAALRSRGVPILDLQPQPGMTPQRQRESIQLLKRLDANYQAGHALSDRLRERLENYELAFRMQSRVPELNDLSREPRHVHQLYGTGEGAQGHLAKRFLLARRFVESGVRFVQIVDNGWDAHDSIPKNHSFKIRHLDQPLAALIRDLKQRGLLDETLVVVAGEFGRSPDNGMRQGGVVPGRDHNPHAMSVLLAGGGCRSGHYIGATDEIGDVAVECVHPIKDFHVTLLHFLGLNDNKLTSFHQGRFKQLSQTGGTLIPELFA